MKRQSNEGFQSRYIDWWFDDEETYTLYFGMRISPMTGRGLDFTLDSSSLELTVKKRNKVLGTKPYSSFDEAVEDADELEIGRLSIDNWMSK